MRAALYCTIFFTFINWASVNAQAERWAIQVFAFGDEAQAVSVAGQLRAVGFDAYSSTPPESSLAQVRIGCFSDQLDADALAQDVRQRVALDALVVPFAEGDDAAVCVTRQLGFIPPAQWGLEAQTATSVTFWLEAAGRRTITFDGDNWQLAQSENEGADPLGTLQDDPLTALLTPGDPPGLSAHFRATQSRGLPLLRADLAGGSLLVASGKLLWSSARAAVLQGGADVFALRLYRP